MIVVTGGAGFIGSAVVWRLNQLGEENVMIVDELRSGEKWKNLNGLKFADIYHKSDFYDFLVEGNMPFSIDAVIHLGACSATTEKDADYLLFNNYKYSQEIAKYCFSNNARFIYASSAATYGDGSFGYDDKCDLNILRPLNMYGYSKHIFDLWIQKNSFVNKSVGLKYFNVYGPNEYHKEDMRSVVHKAFEQVRDTGKVRLFKSYKDEYKDGEQMRDFIYVKDAVDMTLHFLENRGINGLFNIGTGKARTWNDLVGALFSSFGKKTNIEYVDMPKNLHSKYQYFTEALPGKLEKAGYDKPISSLEYGINDYVQNYLQKSQYLGMS